MVKNNKFNLNGNWFTDEVEAKNKKRYIVQGTNKKWLRTRKRIRNKILR